MKPQKPIVGNNFQKQQVQTFPAPNPNFPFIANQLNANPNIGSRNPTNLTNSLNNFNQSNQQFIKQPIIGFNSGMPQMQPVYLIANNQTLPFMNAATASLGSFQGQPGIVYNPYTPFGFNNIPPAQYVYYPQPSFAPLKPTSTQPPVTTRTNLAPALTHPEPLHSFDLGRRFEAPRKKAYTLALPAIEPKTESQAPLSKEPTVLYRYQKPITVDGLKHPSDKYKDLVYRPRYLTSKSILPPTEELIPKLDEDSLPPLISIRNFTPLSTTRKPTVVGNLRLPFEKSDSPLTTTRKPTLVGNLKLPIEKIEPTIVDDLKLLPPEKSPVSRKPTLVGDLKLPVNKDPPQPPIKEEILYKSTTRLGSNFVGKFHYPPEIDVVDASEIKFEYKDLVEFEMAETKEYYRPKSTIVFLK